MEEQVTLRTELMRIVSTALDIPPDSLDGGKTLKDLQVDSLEMMELVIEIEERMGVKLDDLQMDNLATFDDIVSAVSRAGSQDQADPVSITSQ